jgi:predicted enzyme related to lactoylglutathione lyase
LFFVAVDDMRATLTRAQALGGDIVQPVQEVPGTTFGVFADAQGHRVGVAANGEGVRELPVDDRVYVSSL